MDNENKNESKTTTTTTAEQKSDGQVADAFYGKKPEEKQTEEKVTEVKEDKTVKEIPAEKGTEKVTEEKTETTTTDKPVDKVAEKKTETKTTEEKTVEAKAPDKYELKLPEGTKLKPTAVARIERIAREQGLTNDQAQQLLVQDHQAVTEYQKDLDNQSVEMAQSWKTDLENDPVLGGANLKANAEDVRQAMEAHFSKETIEVIDRLGFGDNKIFFKDMLNLGKRLKDDTINTRGGTPPPQRKLSKDVFYAEKN